MIHERDAALQHANNTGHIDWVAMARNMTAAGLASAYRTQKDHYTYWWLDDTLTIVTASILFFYGLYSLVEDTKSGLKWWTSRFWFEPLPPAAEDGGGPASEKGGGPEEATPLKPPPGEETGSWFRKR